MTASLKHGTERCRLLLKAGLGVSVGEGFTVENHSGICNLFFLSHMIE